MHARTHAALHILRRGPTPLAGLPEDAVRLQYGKVAVQAAAVRAAQLAARQAARAAVAAAALLL